MTGSPGYRGRFAPSPSGPLHLGSLFAAVISYLDARAAGGEWLLRIEDIDPPREMPGAADRIIESLRAHGFRWSGPVDYQHERIESFRRTATNLLTENLAFACDCSRQAIRNRVGSGPGATVYPGTCRDRGLADRIDRTSLRLRADADALHFEDRCQGLVESHVATEIGDFVIRRKDGLPAYVLASALDDHAQGITHVVRGIDLLEFTPAQIQLQRVLGLHQPAYLHFPVLVGPDDSKLSKQRGADAIDDRDPVSNLCRCLALIGLPVPESRAFAGVAGVWSWAIERWSPDLLRGRRILRVRNPDLI